MAINVTHTTATPLAEPYRLPMHALRWSAVLAGLAVGIATNLLLVLLGAAAGLAVFDAADATTSGTGVPVAVAAWNTVCMVIAAFTGGYVAARTAGMRRTSDGILHGVVAWGATMLISAFLVSSVAGTTLGTLFNAASPAQRAAGAAAGAEIASQVDEGNRQEAVTVLRNRLGVSNEQASRLVDQALVLSGRKDQASPEGREAAEETLRTASIASGWLSGAILLSLIAAIGGGLLGARGTRRDLRHPVTQHTTTRSDSGLL